MDGKQGENATEMASRGCSLGAPNAFHARHSYVDKKQSGELWNLMCQSQMLNQSSIAPEQGQEEANVSLPPMRIQIASCNGLGT